MGRLVAQVLQFPAWRVITRDEGRAPGEPRWIIEPTGRRHEVLQILRRRLVATCEPQAPIRHEAEVRTAAGDFLITWTEPDGDWRVSPI